MVNDFLTRFVSEENHDEARDSLSEMFAHMHYELAKDFFKNYKSVENDPDTSTPTKKNVPKKKKNVPEKKNNAPEKVKCSGTTKTGKCCRNNALDGSEFCRVHSKNDGSDSETVVEKKKEEPKKKAKKETKKGKKTKKEVPKHNHDLNEEPNSDCDLCETIGNHASENNAEDVFESPDMASKLKEILASADNDNDDDPFGLDLNPDLNEEFDHTGLTSDEDED
jgi:hypothetical protein